MDQTTFADVLQKSFVAMSMGGAERITTLNIIAHVMISFLVAMFIYYIYKKTFQGVLYQKSFNVSLVLASVVTSLVIMTISGNLVLSLGMVGALSIVRFRTPVKDSMDLVFLFWAISSGIANGVGYYNISVLGAILIAIFLLLLTRDRSDNWTWLLVCQLPPNGDTEAIIQQVAGATDSMRLKSKVMTADHNELVFEIKVAQEKLEFVEQMRENGLVEKATLVSYEDGMASA